MRRLIPPYLLAACAVLTVVLVVAVPPWPGLAWAQMLAVAVLALGIWLPIAAVGNLSHRGTTLNPFGTPSVLVTDGLFRYSRNPVYLGFTVFLVGLGLLGASPWALLPALIFAGICNWHYIPFEEQTAARVFGADYAAYRARVRRWL